MVDTSPLTWNTDIQAIAQSYADSYTCSGSLTHSNNQYEGNYLGENLSLGYSFEDADGVSGWFDEIKYYDYSTPGFSLATGHFTQLVWSTTTEVGCGYKYCDSYLGYFVVCNYNPTGNLGLVGDVSYFYALDVHEPKESSYALGNF